VREYWLRSEHVFRHVATLVHDKVADELGGQRVDVLIVAEPEDASRSSTRPLGSRFIHAVRNRHEQHFIMHVCDPVWTNDPNRTRLHKGDSNGRVTPRLTPQGDSCADRAARHTAAKDRTFKTVRPNQEPIARTQQVRHCTREGVSAAPAR